MFLQVEGVVSRSSESHRMTFESVGSCNCTCRFPIIHHSWPGVLPYFTSRPAILSAQAITAVIIIRVINRMACSFNSTTSRRYYHIGHHNRLVRRKQRDDTRESAFLGTQDPLLMTMEGWLMRNNCFQACWLIDRLTLK